MGLSSEVLVPGPGQTETSYSHGADSLVGFNSTTLNTKRLRSQCKDFVQIITLLVECCHHPCTEHLLLRLDVGWFDMCSNRLLDGRTGFGISSDLSNPKVVPIQYYAVSALLRPASTTFSRKWSHWSRCLEVYAYNGSAPPRKAISLRLNQSLRRYSIVIWTLARGIVAHLQIAKLAPGSGLDKKKRHCHLFSAIPGCLHQRSDRRSVFPTGRDNTRAGSGPLAGNLLFANFIGTGLCNG